MAALSLQRAVEDLWLAQHRARRCYRSGLAIEAALALETIRTAATRHESAAVRRLAESLTASIARLAAPPARL